MSNEAFFSAWARNMAFDQPSLALAPNVVASVEGSFGLAKNAKSAPLLRENLEVLTDFLDSLRATPATKRRR